MNQDQTKYTTSNRVLNESMDRDFNVLAVEPLGYDGVNLQRLNASNLSVRLDFNGGSNPVYIGLAAPGTSTSASRWQIRKITYDGNDNPTSIQYCNGSSAFNQVYDDRASLSYS